LKKWGIPIAVASSSFRDAFELKIKNNMELFNLFDAIVLGDDPLVKKGKPAPDIFIEAAKRLGFEPSLNGIVFEDAISGVKAGIAGGFRVVWIPDPNLNAHTMLNDPQNEELRKQFDCKNLVILNSMEEFDPEAFGLKK
jgi:pseudouridine-5'-monophosphatase